MSLIEQINADFKKAMLNHDEFTKVTLSSLKSAIKYKQVDKGDRTVELSDSDIEDVVSKEIKSRSDSIEVYQKASDQLRADKESRERDILRNYLPKQLTPEEIKSVVANVVDEGKFSQKDFGKVIGVAKSKIGAAAEGSQIAAAVKEYFK